MSEKLGKAKQKLSRTKDKISEIDLKETGSSIKKSFVQTGSTLKEKTKSGFEHGRDIGHGLFQGAKGKIYKRSFVVQLVAILLPILWFAIFACWISISLSWALSLIIFGLAITLAVGPFVPLRGSIRILIALLFMLYGLIIIVISRNLGGIGLNYIFETIGIQLEETIPLSWRWFNLVIPEESIDSTLIPALQLTWLLPPFFGLFIYWSFKKEWA